VVTQSATDPSGEIVLSGGFPPVHGIAVAPVAGRTVAAVASAAVARVRAAVPRVSGIAVRVIVGPLAAVAGAVC
jgi:hypothetical protein